METSCLSLWKMKLRVCFAKTDLQARLKTILNVPLYSTFHRVKRTKALRNSLERDGQIWIRLTNLNCVKTRIGIPSMED